jgi:UDP-N-acetylmuramyl tripeptide synthase/very-short-patch-repair endonuclease
MTIPFEDSRRLTGANLYFPVPGAVLETAPSVALDDAAITRWRAHVERLRGELGWPPAPIVARLHTGRGSLAIAAPIDQLFTATEVNELALERALLPFSHREKVPEGRMRERPRAQDQLYILEKKLPFDEEILAFIRNLRHTSTTSERLIWSFVRDRRLRGQKFRRQHAVGPYVLDFYCHDLKLAIELDGSQHGEPLAQEHDVRRDRFLAERGIRTLRYWNNDVLDNLENVLTDIWNCVNEFAEVGQTRDASPSSALRAPSPGGRRQDNFHAPAYPAIWDEELALQTLRHAAAAERRPDLVALIDEAHRRNLPTLFDDTELTLGEGSGARSWPLDALPLPNAIDWKSLHAIPAALVTGSNGKTTTTRLIAAISEAAHRRTAFSSTDGVVIGGETVAGGDYSGPAGARTALRDARAEAAVLETARGGILRRGLAVERVQAAIVTNISADHFGEYGVHDLDDLADAKLVVAHALVADGTLVLNAADDVLVRHAADLNCRIAWFALDANHPLLREHRGRGGMTCGVRSGELVLHAEGADCTLGRIVDMPLSARGAAKYNIGNLAGAALVAQALGIDSALIAQVYARFGASNDDNPGRLMRWTFGATTVLVDYAHNPDGLRGLLDVARALNANGRLAIVLGQAGNREDADIRALAAVAADYRPDRVVLKELASFARGRMPGEIVALLRDELKRDGLTDDALLVANEELDAARTVLEWARDGDLLVLPIHDKLGRADVVALLDKLAATGWKPSHPLPACVA